MDETTSTPGARALAAAGIEVTTADTTGVRSAEEAADRHGLPVGRLLKTLVVRRGDDDYLFVLVPGDRSIAWPKLRSHLGVSRLSMPDADEAREATGYERGAITPLGARVPWPVVADAAVPSDGPVGLGSGVRGISLRVHVTELLGLLDAEVADVTEPA